MIDDDDEKVRRNLVVFSSVVILGYWLNLEVAQIALEFFKLGGKVDPLRLCWAALAILIYLGARYKDAKLRDGKNYLEIVDADLAVITPKVAFHYARIMAHVYTVTGFQASMFLNSLVGFVRQRGNIPNDQPITRRPRLVLRRLTPQEATMNSRHNNGENASVRWHIGMMRKMDINRYEPAPNWSVLAVQPSGVHSVLIWIYSRLWWYLYCDAAIRARLPVWLGIVAAIILGYKAVAFSTAT